MIIKIFSTEEKRAFSQNFSTLVGLQASSKLTKQKKSLSSSFFCKWYTLNIKFLDENQISFFSPMVAMEK